jgi:glycogen phosphorylase
MIEKINSRTKIGTSISSSQNAHTDRMETPQRWRTDRDNLTTIVPNLPQSWRRRVGENFNGKQFEAPTCKIAIAEDILFTPQSRADRAERHSNIAVKPFTPNSDIDVNPRQWLLMNNPRLASLVTEAIDDRWIAHLEDLQQLAPIADNPEFQSQWRAVKQANKQTLADDLDRVLGVKIDVNSLFDVQLQPIDGHQRQLLNILHIITLYHRIKENPLLNIVPRTFIFGDIDNREAAVVAPDGQDINLERQIIILLIQSLAETLVADPDVQGRLQVVYIPRSAGLTNQIYCAADLTEQIATAGMDDVDLSQPKLSVNGALSIASMGKANHLLQQTVGSDNCFSFGLAIPEIALFKRYGYEPYNYYKYYPEIRQAIDSLMSGLFTAKYPGLCRDSIDLLLDTDEHMVLADYIFYRTCQERVSEIYRQASLWTRMSILNVAGVG